VASAKPAHDHGTFSLRFGAIEIALKFGKIGLGYGWFSIT
jgi:hypothetical protein